MKSNLTLMKKEADVFGLLFLLFGAKNSRTPLLNILVYDKKSPEGVLELFGF